MDIGVSGWKRSASNAPAVVEQLKLIRKEIRKDFPIRDIVVLGMGGSVSAARVLASHFENELREKQVRLRIADTTEPSSVEAILRDFNSKNGIVIVSSRSGSNIEALCLGQLFTAQLKAVLGDDLVAAKHFISISEENTPLSMLAETQNWRGSITVPRDVSGRFQALTAFGLAPVVFAGINIEEILQAAEQMEFICFDGTLCPAYCIAESIHQNFLDGKDKLIISYDEEARYFARWLEQLIAESLGKDGKGVIPLPVPRQRAEKLMQQDCPDLQSISLVDLDSKDIGGDFVRWMYAIEKLAEMLEIDPFDQPITEALKQSIRFSLRRSSGTHGFTSLSQQLTDHRVWNAQFLPSIVGPSNYVVLKSWAPPSPENTRSLENLASSFQDYFKRPVVIAEGPGYMHSSSQMYKGGPNSGVFVMVAQESEADFAIPGAQYSLRQLYRAAFCNDLSEMLAYNRIVVKL